MQKSDLLDLHVISIPDHRAEMAVAQIIVGTNKQISMHTAIEMAKNPPILLYHRLEPGAAEQFISNLKSLNIGFKVSVSESAGSDTANSDITNSNITNSNITDSNIPKSNIPNSNTVADDNGGDTQKAAEVDRLFGEFAGIREHNADTKKNQSDSDGAADILPRGTARKPHQTAEELQKSILSAIGHHHENDHSGHGYRSGIRVGEIGLDDLRKAEDAARRKSLVVTCVIAGALLLFALVTFLLPKDRGAAIRAIALPTRESAQKVKRAANGAEQAAQAREAPAPARGERDTQRSQVGGDERRQANNYVDSARAGALDDPEKIISFYKMAISFNRYNLPAWQGLLQAYRDFDRSAEARETEERMRELFGSEVMHVNTLVRQFGEIADAYMNDDGTYRLEYRTNKRARNDIMREVFTMTRSVRSVCRCRDISIFASTGPGRGLIVHSTQETSVHTLSTFSRQAEVIWLE